MPTRGDAPELTRPTELEASRTQPSTIISAPALLTSPPILVNNVIPTLDRTVQNQSEFDNRVRASILTARRGIPSLRVKCEVRFIPGFLGEVNRDLGIRKPRRSWSVVQSSKGWQSRVEKGKGRSGTSLTSRIEGKSAKLLTEVFDFDDRPFSSRVFDSQDTLVWQ